MIGYLERLPRRSLYVLGLVALVFLGSAYLTWTNVQDASAQISVENQLSNANRTLQQTTQANNLDSAKQDLAAAQAQLSDVAFPDQPPSVDLVAVLVQAAKDTGVQLGNLQLTATEQEKVGSNNYNVMRQRLQFSGTPSQLAAFFSRIENGGLKSLVMNNLSLSPNGGIWQGRIDLYLYSSR